jgi:predicted nucleotidyltransferase
MDKRRALLIAKKYIKVVKNFYPVRKSVLFGSYVKGNYHDESDIDIAIIFRHPGDIITMQIELMRLRRDIDLRIEPHPFDEKDFNRLNPVANEIIKYGVEIKIQ